MPEPATGDELEVLLADRGPHLLRTAVLLAGSQHDGEDLLQTALERVVRRRRVDGNLEAYLRRVMYNLAADGWRRRGAWNRKLPLVRASQPDAVPDVAFALDLRDALIRTLRELSPQQRTVIVLRYWVQLSEAETARALGCTEGTVKASASRGLKRMRELSGSWLDNNASVAGRLTPNAVRKITVSDTEEEHGNRI